MEWDIQRKKEQLTNLNSETNTTSHVFCGLGSNMDELERDKMENRLELKEVKDDEGTVKMVKVHSELVLSF